MLEIFRKLKAGPVSATALRDALGALDPEAIVRTVSKREEARREAILTGDGKAIGAAEAALAEARLEAERIGIAREELAARLSEAEAREADEAAAARVKAFETRRDALRKKIERELAPALRTTCGILSEIVALDAEIGAVNDQMDRAGRPERIAPTESGWTPHPETQLAAVWALTATITIRPIKGWSVEGWNWPGHLSD